MIQILQSIAVFALFIFLFLRETCLDQKKLDEADHEGDAHMRELKSIISERPKDITYKL